MSQLRLSVRTRWAAMFGGLFLVAGTALLLINYVLVNQIVPDGTRFIATAVEAPPGKVPPVVIREGVLGDAGAPPDAAVWNESATTVVDSFRESTMRTLLVASGLTLIAAGVIAALLGWVMARRALRPVHTITATARRLEAESLDRRINLDGPADELKELADTFDGMLDRLAVAFDSQRRFVANASHELRTPLAVQRTLVEVAMADPTASPELLRLGQHLLHTNERSERLIEGLLVLARSDRGLVERAPVRLDRIADGVLRFALGQATEQAVTLHRRLLPRTVTGDPVLVERLVSNLVDNAIHYNTSGGWVLVEVGHQPALVVTNAGPAVPASEVPGLFEPFRRLHRDRTAGRDGAGLGLSIVRSVAAAHGGSVHAVPNPDGGLRITVSFPTAMTGDRDQHHDQPPAASLAAPETLGVPTGQGAG